VPDSPANLPPVTTVAAELARRLDRAHCEYALGGAIALAYWSEPRGTVDVDVSLFISAVDPSQTIDVLRRINAEFDASSVQTSIETHGFCRVRFMGRVLDVFLPIAMIYEPGRLRRQRVNIDGYEAMIWDAETLCVFKMMFFRRKDLADLESILLTQGAALDRSWIEQQLIAMYGQRDPRIGQWRELVAEL
jgi:predicted nucleotidyltransferase